MFGSEARIFDILLRQQAAAVEAGDGKSASRRPAGRAV